MTETSIENPNDNTKGNLTSKAHQDIQATALPTSSEVQPVQPSAIAVDSKELLTKEIATLLFEMNFSSSEELLTYLKSKYHNSNIVNSLKINSDDDKYGILTLTLIDKMSDSHIEFRLKKPDAYGGPKTEDYLGRINLRVDAALELIQKEPALQSKKEELESLRQYYIDKIKMDCNLDHTILGSLDRNNDAAVKEFNTKHAKAKDHMATFMALMIVTLSHNAKSSSEIKNELYTLERDLMSTRRPERITIRKLNTELMEINTSSPVMKDKTVSSAKKDEAGVANWLKTKNEIYIQKPGNLEKVKETESYRSASIIPHELISKGELNRQLAIDVTRRNVSEHILPVIAKELMKKKPAEDPLIINYEMLTLLSPMHKVIDRKDSNNPDATQFSAIRTAFDHYDGRTFEIKLENGQLKKVTLDATFHNYGTNLGRGFPIENATNMKAYNKLIDRSLNSLSGKKGIENFKILLDKIPEFNEIQTQKINNAKIRLHIIYEGIDNKQIEKEKHNELVTLNAKKINYGLSDEETAKYEKLASEFQSFAAFKINAMKEARKLEGSIRHINVDLAKNRKKYFSDNYSAFNTLLTEMEKSRDNKEINNTIDHIRTLTEYSQMVDKGYDSHLEIAVTTVTKRNITKTNQRNYEVQSYIRLLNTFNDTPFQFTCKSGKDRTNSAEEKYKAKEYMAVVLSRIPKYKESKAIKAQELSSYEKGYLQGAGNDICGDNMKPGAQQVAASDIGTDTVDIRPVQAMAGLQKGLDLLEISSEKLAKASNDFNIYRSNQKSSISPKPIATTTTISSPSVTSAPAPKNIPVLRKSFLPSFDTAKTNDSIPPTNTIAEVRKLSLNEFTEKLAALKDNNQLNQFGVMKYSVVEATNITPSHVKMIMFNTKNTGSTDKTSEVKTTTTGTDSINYSVNSNLLADEKLQIIIQICQLAVATAKPGTQFNIPGRNAVQKTATEDALDAALAAMYPEYIKGQFKVPNSIQATAVPSQTNSEPNESKNSTKQNDINNQNEATNSLPFSPATSDEPSNKPHKP